MDPRQRVRAVPDHVEIGTRALAHDSPYRSSAHQKADDRASAGDEPSTRRGAPSAVPPDLSTG
ncbi:hypothetical protein DUI70_2671 [Streptomyces albus]|nr:hypothetical protein DUI70_2671 [Streptomyces albus]